VFDDIASLSLRSALDGLAARQRAISENIANVQTPNYHAVRVSFEDNLRQAIEDGGPAYVEPSRATSLEPTREDGNNVNLDTETLSSVDTNLRYQLALRAMDHEYSLIRTSLRTNS
jgi:flagellar basal-body rod protein FlgB